MKTTRYPFLFILLLFFSCKSTIPFKQVSYINYSIEKSIKKDSSISGMLKHYSDSVNKTMNEVIGFSITNLGRKKPDETLGNFLVDCMKQVAAQKYNTKVDGAIMNEGGIRIGFIGKGDITIGKVYELMPFDNVLVLQKIKGDVLQQLLDHAAARGGWPVAGLTMHIKDKRAIDVMVNDKPLDNNANYILALPDYLANGGDDCVMLKVLPQKNNGYLIRDAIIDYVSGLTKQGKPVNVKPENRIIYDN